MTPVPDFFTSTELIPKKRRNKWIQRPGFRIRKAIILKWIVLGNILTLGYKKSLLSSLVPIRYEDTIDSMHDLDKSGLPLLMAKGTWGVKHLKGDSGTMMARIVRRRILFLLERGYPPRWVFERYA